MIVAVSVNHSGPYNFLLDTGTQISMIDPALATALHLDPEDAATVWGLGSHQSVSLAQVDLLQAGSHAVEKLRVLVNGLQRLHSADLQIQGILGEDFLEHFDTLIDNVHNLLCLDDSTAMRAAVRGKHIALAAPVEMKRDGALASLLIVEARLSDGTRPVRLMLDSGTNASFLYNAPRYMNLPLFQSTVLRGSGVDGKQRIFSPLPAQEMRIGTLELSRVPFYTVARAQQGYQAAEFDGLLTMGLFRRVFICHTDHFAILEPR